jgi:hypothetical protein
VLCVGCQIRQAGPRDEQCLTHNLISVVIPLTRCACSSLYRANAPKLESVLCLMEKFEPYHDIPKVQSLKDMVDLIARSLHQQLLREFQLQWIVTDPFAGRHIEGSGGYEDKQQMRSEQEQVTPLMLECFDRIPRLLRIVSGCGTPTNTRICGPAANH